MRSVVGTVALVVLASTAHAGFLDGGKLLRFLNADIDSNSADPKVQVKAFSDSTEGIGYVAGVHDLGDDLLLFCTPQEVTVGQVVAVVKKFLTNHPEKWHEPAAGLAVQALSEAFPCKRK